MTDTVKVLKALADESRYNILSLLVSHDLCVGALAGRLGISEAAVSQHLQILRKAGLVMGEKRGYFTHYWVDRKVLRKTAEDLMELADRMPDTSDECHRATPDGICFAKDADKER